MTADYAEKNLKTIGERVLILLTETNPPVVLTPTIMEEMDPVAFASMAFVASMVLKMSVNDARAHVLLNSLSDGGSYEIIGRKGLWIMWNSLTGDTYSFDESFSTIRAKSFRRPWEPL